MYQQATLFVFLAAGMNGRDKAICLWGLCVKGTPSESQFIDCDAFLAPWELLGEVRLYEDPFPPRRRKTFMSALLGLSGLKFPHG